MNPPPAQVDREEAALLARAKEGDLRAFEALVERHGERVYAVVLRFGLSSVDAEEVVQDVFVRAWRSLDGFQGRARLSTWLYRIAFNEAHRKLNRPAAARREVSLDEVGERFDAVDQAPRLTRRLSPPSLPRCSRRNCGHCPTGYALPWSCATSRG